MVGFALSSFSVLYGLLVGLIAVAAYQNFSTVERHRHQRSLEPSGMYRDLHGYPQPIRGGLQDDLREYTRYVIDKAWPEQRRASYPPRVRIE